MTIQVINYMLGRHKRAFSKLSYVLPIVPIFDEWSSNLSDSCKFLIGPVSSIIEFYLGCNCALEKKKNPSKF